MSANPNNARNSLIAAALILVIVGLALHFMPQMVMGIARHSTVLAAIFVFVPFIAFFLVFWLRAKYKK
jgi:hypothetical protein